MEKFTLINKDRSGMKVIESFGESFLDDFAAIELIRKKVEV